MMNIMNKFSTETQRTQSYTEKNAQRRDVACRVLAENVSLARICNSYHTNTTHGLQIRASRIFQALPGKLSNQIYYKK